MDHIFMCILSLSLSGALTGAVILLIRPLTGKLFSKKWNYYIWLVVIVRLLLPIHFETALFTGNGSGLAQNFGLTAAQQSQAVQGSQKARPIDAQQSESSSLEQKGMLENKKGQTEIMPDGGNLIKWSAAGIGLAAGTIWLLGAGISLVIKLRDYRKFTAGIRKDLQGITDGRIDAMAKGLAARLHMKRTPAIYESKSVSGPITLGVLRPVIVLPAEERNLSQLPMVLHHELIHVKRKDLWYKWLFQLLLCIHWFNPVLYLAGRRLNTDCELSCDEAVLMALSQEGKRAYGNILINVAEQSGGFRRNIPSVTLLESKADLKERLKGILHYKKGSGFRAFISAWALLAVAFFAACGSVQAAPGAMPVQVPAHGLADRYVSGEEKALYNDGEHHSFWEWMWELFADESLDEGLDGFLDSPAYVNKLGDAWKAYDHDELISGDDIEDQWRAFYYRGGDDRIECTSFYLNGTDSILIMQVEKETDIEVESVFELREGRFKIVQILPGGEVKALNESGDKTQARVTLEEGRNVIKMVGQGAMLRNLTISYSGLKNKNISHVYYSSEAEYGARVTENVENGNAVSEQVDKDRVIDAMPYLDNDTRVKLIMALEEELTFDVLEECAPYIGSDGLEECLLYYLELGNGLTFSQFNEISPYLNSSTIGKLDDLGEIGEIK